MLWCPVRRGKVAHSSPRVWPAKRCPVTVCIAALFRWNYAAAGKPPDLGVAAVAVSDRMITAGDVQYEPAQSKVALVGRRIAMLIAGDYPVHSQALRITLKYFGGKPDATSLQIANFYGAQIQAIQRKQAEDHILVPLGLNTDSFLAQQKDMSEGFIATTTSDLQNFRGADVEALVVGIDADGLASLYHIDHRGVIGAYDDVGFAAIGIGAWHARSSLMQAGYTNQAGFFPALAAVYHAKKIAEIAPGVGKGTDVHLIFRSGVEKLWTGYPEKLAELYDKYEGERAKLGTGIIEELERFTRAQNPPPHPQAPQPETPTGTGPKGSGDDQGSGSTESAEVAAENTGEVQG